MLVKPPFFGRPKVREIAKAHKLRKPVENEKKTFVVLTKNRHFVHESIFISPHSSLLVPYKRTQHCWPKTPDIVE